MADYYFLVQHAPNAYEWVPVFRTIGGQNILKSQGGTTDIPLATVATLQALLNSL